MKPKSFIGIFIYFSMNMALILFLFSADYIIQRYLIALYIGATILSLTPLGEGFLCILANAKKIPRKDMNIKLIPLVEIVLNNAIDYMPPMVKTIKLRYIEDTSPMAYAIGRKTICVTSGLLQLSDDLILGALSHEIGHLALKHTTWQLLIGGSNFFISVFIGFIKSLLNFLVLLSGVSILPRQSRIMGIVFTFLSAVVNLGVRLWIKLSMLFLCWTKRQNEYEADAFAYEIGFGNQLAAVLDKLESPQTSTLITTLLSSHPSNNERIGRLQIMGATYSAY